jgi:cytochrome o ubiquinol oxidase subunit 1
VVFAWRDEDEELIPADEVARIDREHLAQRHAMANAGAASP